MVIFGRQSKSNENILIQGKTTNFLNKNVDYSNYNRYANR